MSKTIIFATDFSTASDAALNLATDLAKGRDAKLLIVHVEEPPFAYGGGELYYGVPEPDEAALQEMLGELRPADSKVPYEHRLIVGHPAQTIVDLAKDEDAELIVMGSHGRTGIGRALLGSVAEVVVRRAACPVLVVKNPHFVPTGTTSVDSP